METSPQISPFSGIRFTPAQRVIILVVALCLFTIIGSALVAIVMRNGVTTPSLRVATVIQDCIVFILPAVISALFISPYAARFLGIDRGFRILQLLLAVICMIASIPAMNALVKFNECLTLPESLVNIEQWMRAAEEQAQESVTILLGQSTVGSLVISLLIVGVLAGVSEELFFRGALQRIFMSCRMNTHVAVWLTAFVFSAFHLQFFGFFPRLLLGAYFGYLFYWSKSLWLPIAMHVFNNSMVICVMWHDRAMGDMARQSESLNDWGADSAMLIIDSVLFTAFILVWLYKKRTIAQEKNA